MLILAASAASIDWTRRFHPVGRSLQNLDQIRLGIAGPLAPDTDLNAFTGNGSGKKADLPVRQAAQSLPTKGHLFNRQSNFQADSILHAETILKPKITWKF